MQAWLDILTWTLVAGSLIGGQLVINKKKAGYFIWVLVNLLWVAFYFYKEIYASVALFSVYMAQAAIGYSKWNKEPENEFSK